MVPHAFDNALFGSAGRVDDTLMRILHVIPALAPRFGGPSKVALEMCRELATRGHQVAIYTTNFDGPNKLDVALLCPVPDESGVKITYFPVRPHTYYCTSLALAAALKRDIAGYDVVHIHSLYRFSSTAAAHYCRIHGVPYVMCPHGALDPFLFRRHRLRKWLYEILLDRPHLEGAAAVQFTACEEMELAMSTEFALKGVVVPLGVSVESADRAEAIRELHSRWPETIGRKVVLFLGRLTFKKGLDLLARAFGDLCRRRDDVHLLIAGPDDEGYGTQVRRWLQSAGALGRTSFSGMILGREKTTALAAADVFVLPSYSENFGVALVEALASGLPSIISNRVNIWREIAGEDAGIVINPDASELARALLRVLDDPVLWGRMSAASRRLAAERFNWRVAGDRLVEVYREIADASPDSRPAAHPKALRHGYSHKA